MRLIDVPFATKTETETPQGDVKVNLGFGSKVALQSGYGETILLHKRISKSVEREGASLRLDSIIAKRQAYEMQHDYAEDNPYEKIMNDVKQQLNFMTRSHKQPHEHVTFKVPQADQASQEIEVRFAAKPSLKRTWDDIRDPHVGLVETGKRVIAAQKMFLFGL